MVIELSRSQSHSYSEKLKQKKKFRLMLVSVVTILQISKIWLWPSTLTYILDTDEEFVFVVPLHCGDAESECLTKLI